MDYGHKQTDKMLGALEKRIDDVYRIAAKDVEKSMKAYLSNYAVNDAKMAKLVKEGVITNAEYVAWRKKQMLITQKWVDMRAELTDRYMNANANASKMINEHKLDVYALNFNYGTYEIETGAKVDTAFSLYNRNAVVRLMRDDPKLLPPIGKKTSKAIRDGKARRWTQREIQSVMTQSLLAGESMPKISKRLAEAVGEKSKVSAIRAARTMTTSAENAGRLDSYERAKELGIETAKTWVSAHDSRVRASHVEMDGETTSIELPFSNDLMYPADPDGEPAEVYNCRCTIVATVVSVDGIDVSDITGGAEWNMDYEEWYEAHEG